MGCVSVDQVGFEAAYYQILAEGNPQNLTGTSSKKFLNKRYKSSSLLSSCATIEFLFETFILIAIPSPLMFRSEKRGWTILNRAEPSCCFSHIAKIT